MRQIITQKNFALFLIFFGLGLIIISFFNISKPATNTNVEPESFPISLSVVPIMGRITEVAVSTERKEVNTSKSTLPTGHALWGMEKSLENQKRIKESEIWTATDYKAEDISGSTYTVQLGDTLWEIAEGHYGNGLKWQTILNLNSDKIGFLPNGEQALIFPGQILIL